MAVRYKFQTNLGEHDRRLVIPETPTEKLRGETYEQEQIDWLHESEKGQINLAVGRLQTEENARASRDGDEAKTVTLEKVWTERANPS